MSNGTLIVYVPGITMSVEQWEPLVSRLRQEPEFRDTTWRGWDHHIGLFSIRSIMSKAEELRAVVDAEWQLAGGFDEVILVGHSIGGILVRQCYLLAGGCYRGEPASIWPKHMRRIVLLAGVNRGLDQTKWRVRLYDLVTRFLGVLLFRRFMAQEFISGSESITDLRLKWIKHMRSLLSEQQPGVVQILGTVDSVVTRRDSVDLEQFPNASHISVPGVNHRQLPLINEGPNGEMRYRFIRDALLGRVIPEVEPPLVAQRKEQIVFVLHGIRAANRGWVQALEERLRESMPNAKVITPSYGYLSALDFAVPFLHRRPVRDFQQLYSDSYAENPGARFHFIGHSNGTYILGQSLRALSAMKFDRVMLAGSVLPRSFGWHELMSGSDPQVGVLRNDCANADWPVGFLCSGLTGLWRRDVGTGGYEGFLQDDEKVFQYWFHEGGHGAALSEENLASIANFLASGDGSSKPPHLGRERPGFSLLSRLAPWLFRLLLACLILALALAAWKGNVALALGVIAALVVVTFVLKVL
jgi:pimeloyl-ACP methyl ester carboxylesterase